VGVCSNPFERVSSLAFAEAEGAERLKSLFVHRNLTRIDGAAVQRAIAMPKNEPAGNPALDDELSAVQRSGMSAAQDHQVVGAVVATLGARHDVMHIHGHCLTTRRNDAPPPSRRMTRRCTGRSRLVGFRAACSLLPQRFSALASPHATSIDAARVRAEKCASVSLAQANALAATLDDGFACRRTELVKQNR